MRRRRPEEVVLQRPKVSRQQVTRIFSWRHNCIGSKGAHVGSSPTTANDCLKAWPSEGKRER